MRAADGGGGAGHPGPVRVLQGGGGALPVGPGVSGDGGLGVPCAGGAGGLPGAGCGPPFAENGLGPVAGLPGGPGEAGPGDRRSAAQQQWDAGPGHGGGGAGVLFGPAPAGAGRAASRQAGQGGLFRRPARCGRLCVADGELPGPRCQPGAVGLRAAAAGHRVRDAVLYGFRRHFRRGVPPPQAAVDGGNDLYFVRRRAGVRRGERLGGRAAAAVPDAGGGWGAVAAAPQPGEPAQDQSEAPPKNPWGGKHTGGDHP